MTNLNGISLTLSDGRTAVISYNGKITINGQELCYNDAGRTSKAKRQEKPKKNKSKYIDFTVNAGGEKQQIKIEKGVTFENNGYRYKVQNDGKLSIFDKKNNTTTVSDTLNMTKYQFNIFKAVADNVNEFKKNVGQIILSAKDINSALKMFKKGKLTEDLSQDLPAGYSIERSTIYSKNKTLQVDVQNDVKNKHASTLYFHHGKKDILPDGIDNTNPVQNEEPISDTTPAQQTPSSSKVSTDRRVQAKPATTHTFRQGDDLVRIAKKYGIDTYTLIAANPQLKEGKDYKLSYSKNTLMNLETKVGKNLKPGVKLNIPQRYFVQPGSVKTDADIEKVTGVSASYISNILKSNEGYKPYVYDDATGKRVTNLSNVRGTLTIGFGHCGSVDGKSLAQLVREGNKPISKEKANEILANDLLEHKQRAIAYFGDSYTRAPQSVQDTLFDIVYNKGIWDGFKSKHYAKNTKHIKKYLDKNNYVEVLAHSAKSGNSKSNGGLYKRSVQRFIHGLRDLSASDRQKAMKKFEKEYKNSIKRLKGAERAKVERQWADAKNGKITV